ncbi:MAG: 2Fe-2S iron-sulfur cluster binding domain-containing protein [Ectothiorhodospiraceae bacterium]|nr:2Fe-2S iron-sulfur cluster binding domain-containing protein [Ectothiorhodospiraceae bacterium]
MHLHVLPLERQIAVDAGSNLLDVLLSNDVPISHSCMAGRCGTCRCRVVRGGVAEQVPYEGRPTMVSSPGRHVLACQTTLTEDCVIEIPEVDEVVVHPARIIKGTVSSFDAVTHDVRRLRIRPNKPLAYSPGQYTHVQFAADVVRPYSPAGLDSDEELEYHIRIIPGGRVTQHIEASVRPGDKVRISGPLGTSYLRRKHDGPMLCIAGGTGLAPTLSVVRGALESGMESHPVHLFFGVRAERDIYDADRINALAERFPNFHPHIVLSAPDSPTRYPRGLVTDAVTELLPQLDGWRAYLAGPPAMVEAATLLVVDRGVRPQHVHADAFYPTGI